MSIGEAGIDFFKKEGGVGGQGSTSNRSGLILGYGERQSGVRGEGYGVRRIPERDTSVISSNPDINCIVKNQRASLQKQIPKLILPEIKG